MAQDDVQKILIELSEIKTLLQRTGIDVDDHEGRIRCLEQRSGKRLDSVTTAIVSAIIGAIVTGIAMLLTRQIN